jgi:hypothetical protein
MDDQRPVRFFNLALFARIRLIRPILHHSAALLHVFGMVAGGANRVRVGMRQLRLDPRLADSRFH